MFEYFSEVFNHRFLVNEGSGNNRRAKLDTKKEDMKNKQLVILGVLTFITVGFMVGVMTGLIHC